MYRLLIVVTIKNYTVNPAIYATTSWEERLTRHICWNRNRHVVQKQTHAQTFSRLPNGSDCLFCCCLDRLGAARRGSSSSRGGERLWAPHKAGSWSPAPVMDRTMTAEPGGWAERITGSNMDVFTERERTSLLDFKTYFAVDVLIKDRFDASQH